MLVWWRYNTRTHTQPFYGFLDFVQDNVLGEPVPEDFLEQMNIQQSGWTATPSRLIDALTSAIPTIITQDALPYTTLPIYPGLGQAPNMLACIPSGLVGGDTKVEVKAKELFGRERIKLCVMHGIVRHNACAIELQPALHV